MMHNQNMSDSLEMQNKGIEDLLVEGIHQPTFSELHEALTTLDLNKELKGGVVEQASNFGASFSFPNHRGARLFALAIIDEGNSRDLYALEPGMQFYEAALLEDYRIDGDQFSAWETSKEHIHTVHFAIRNAFNVDEDKKTAYSDIIKTVTKRHIPDAEVELENFSF